MREFSWWELFLPHGLTLDQVTALLRPMASRPLLGLARVTPTVVIEQWHLGGRTRHLLAVEAPLKESFVRGLAASVSGLVVRAFNPAERPAVRSAAPIRLNRLSASLRTDVSAQVSTAVGAAFASCPPSQAMVLQWVLGPTQHQRHAPPREFDVLAALGLRALRESSTAELAAWKQKALEPLFMVRGSIGSTDGPAALHGLISAVQLADSSHGAVEVGRPSPQVARAVGRIAREGSGSIASAKEVAVLLALPIDGASGRVVPIGDVPPLPRRGGRHLGLSKHPASLDQLVAQPVSSLSRHTHIVGPTGSGKSNLLCLDGVGRHSLRPRFHPLRAEGRPV
ncbi:hypothetical protein [Nocardia brasiliensis]